MNKKELRLRIAQILHYCQKTNDQRGLDYWFNILTRMRKYTI